jgi:hypothetical protein
MDASSNVKRHAAISRQLSAVSVLQNRKVLRLGVLLLGLRLIAERFPPHSLAEGNRHQRRDGDW